MANIFEAKYGMTMQRCYELMVTCDTCMKFGTDGEGIMDIYMNSEPESTERGISAACMERLIADWRAHRAKLH